MLPLPSSDSIVNEPMCDSQDSLPNPSVPAVIADSVKTLTKAELADLLFDKVGLNKREAKDLVDTFFDEIREVLGHGDLVKISGFGNFQIRDKSQRPGRNPKTGEVVPIAARRVVTFHASQKLKSMLEKDDDKVEEFK